MAKSALLARSSNATTLFVIFRNVPETMSQQNKAPTKHNRFVLLALMWEAILIVNDICIWNFCVLEQISLNIVLHVNIGVKNMFVPRDSSTDFCVLLLFSDLSTKKDIACAHRDS